MWSDLQDQYSSITQTQVDPGLRQSLTNLYEFDRLCYSYHALKSYYDLSKSRLDLDYRNLLDDLASLNARIEDKIPVAELYSVFPQLQVLRRQLKENAKEGGKVAFLIVSLSADMGVFQTLLEGIDASATRETPAAAKQTEPPSKPVTSATPMDVQTGESRGLRASNGAPVASNTQSAHPAPVSRAQAAGEISRVAGIHSTSAEPLASSTGGPDRKPAPHKPSVEATHKPSTDLGTTAQKRTPPPVLASPSKKRAVSASPNSKRAADDSFGRFRTWTREHDVCIFQAALKDPHNAVGAIRDGLRHQFGVAISPDAAKTLRLHYGMASLTHDKYQYYIQAFHLVALQFHDNRHYVTVPWAEIRMQFARRTGLTLDDWEVRGRYLLFLLHRAVYGSSGEPPSNYSDLHENWKREIASRALAPNPLVPLPARLDFSTNNDHITVEDEETVWTPQMLALLVTAHVKVPLDTPNRMLTIKHYMRLASNVDIELKEIEDRLRWKDIEGAVFRGRQDAYQAAQARGANAMAILLLVSSSPARGPGNGPGNHVSASQPLKNHVSASQPLQNQVSASQPVRARVPASQLQNHVPPSQPQNHVPPSQLQNHAPPTQSRPLNQFDQLLNEIDALKRPDWYYHSKIKPAILTEFWDFEKCKCVYITVEFVLKIPHDTDDLTLKVARSNLKKVARLRLLRAFKIKVLESLVENKLMHLMEHDVFDAAMVATIHSNIGR